MRWLVNGSLRQRRTVAVVTVLVVAGALVQLRGAKVDALPEFGPPIVEVQTEALGLSAPEVEQLLSGPLERNFLNGLPHLDTVTSRSVPGLSSIKLQFEPGTDIFTARQLVQERLSLSAELANVAKPPQMLQATSASSRVLMVGVSSSKLSLVDLSVLAKFMLRPRLLGVPGVANVAVFGEQPLQLQVQVDPRRLAAKGVTLDQIVTTTGNGLFVSPLTFLQASTPGNGGLVDNSNQRLAVQHILPVRNPADLSRITVVEASQPGGAPVRLGDVATVVQDHPPLIGNATVDSGPGLVLAVEKLPGANTVDVANDVRAALDSLSPGLPDVQFDPSIYRPASYVTTASDNLTKGVGLGLLVLAIGLGLIFLEWRSALVALVLVPLPLLAAAYVLYARGTTFDAMTVAGLFAAVGLVIFDAVAVVGAMGRALRRREQRSTDEAIGTAVGGIGRSLLYANVICVVALLPVLFLAHLPEKPFLPRIAASFALAVGAATVVALIIAPALLALSRWRARPPVSDARGTRVVSRVHERALAPLLRIPAIGVLIALVLAVVGGVAVSQMSSSLRPSFDESDLFVRWEGPPGTSLAETNRVLARAAAEVRAVRGVRDVGSYAGRAVGSDQVVGSASGELWVSLEPKANSDAALADVRQVVAGYPGFSPQVLRYYDNRVARVGETVDSPVAVRVLGADFAVMRTKADEIKSLLDRIPGVTGAAVEQQASEPTIQVSVDLAAAERAGIKPGDVRRGAATLVSGLEVGALYEDQSVFQVVVVGDPTARSSLSAVQDLVIDTPAGGHVRLGDIAQVTVGPSLSLIKHEDVSKTLDVTAGISGRSRGDVLADVRRALATVSFPSENNARLLDDDLNARHTAQWKVAGAGAAAAVLILLLLQAALESWLLALIGVVAIPLALTGAAAAVWADDSVLSLGGLIGLFAVGAVAVRCTVLTLAGLRELEGLDLGLRVADRVAWISRDRAVPVLQGALATALAFVPLLVLGREAGTELIRPMALVILGGLISVVLVDLLVLPAAYALLRRDSGAPLPGFPVEEPTPTRVDPSRDPLLEGTDVR
ncbi:MAG TPA: efflux RND transporter permease subunit [Sporichthya sp.]|nr:efflux RND transporter permease subunit [Sporichthya sp.]